VAKPVHSEGSWEGGHEGVWAAAALQQCCRQIF